MKFFIAVFGLTIFYNAPPTTSIFTYVFFGFFIGILMALSEHA
jgi:hypothetical protein